MIKDLKEKINNFAQFVDAIANLAFPIMMILTQLIVLVMFLYLIFYMIFNQ